MAGLPCRRQSDARSVAPRDPTGIGTPQRGIPDMCEKLNFVGIVWFTGIALAFKRAAALVMSVGCWAQFERIRKTSSLLFRTKRELQCVHASQTTRQFLTQIPKSPATIRGPGC